MTPSTRIGSTGSGPAGSSSSTSTRSAAPPGSLSPSAPADGCAGCERRVTFRSFPAREERDVTTAIQTNGLTKDYGSGHGIFDLDLTVNEGEVFGYLGPNGAGKTTTIKLLMGLIHATKGRATILGLDAGRDAVPLKHKIGYVPGELPQFGGWRGSEIVA